MTNGSAAGGTVVLVTGPQRSGTTLVRRVLEAHEDLAVVPTDSWLLPRTDTVARAAGVDVGADRFAPDDLLRVVTAATSEGPLSKWGLGPEAVLAEVGAPTWDGVFVGMVRAFQRANDGRTVVMKSPRSAAYVRTAVGALEREGHSARLVVCVRHPVATYRSWANRSGAGGWSDGERGRDPRLWAGRWLREVGTGLELLAAPPCPATLVRYEDLIAGPAAVADSLCDLVGVPSRSGPMAAALDRPPNSSFTGQARGERGADGALAGEAERLVTRMCAARALAVGYSLDAVEPVAPLEDRLRDEARGAMAAMSARAVAAEAAADLAGRLRARVAGRVRRRS